MKTSASITISATAVAYRPRNSTSAPTVQGLMEPLTPRQRERLPPQAGRAGSNVQPGQAGVQEDAGEAAAVLTDHHHLRGGARREGWPRVTRAFAIPMLTLIGAWLVAPLDLFAQDAPVQAPGWRCMDQPRESMCQEAYSSKF